jgi:hypothetical protein
LSKYFMHIPRKSNAGRKQKGLYQSQLNTTPQRTAPIYKGIYTIYGLSSSIEPNDIKYIGYTSMDLNRRYSRHMTTSKLDHTSKERWVKAVLEMGSELIMTILEDDIHTCSEAGTKEMFHVEFYLQAGTSIYPHGHRRRPYYQITFRT